MNDSLNLSLGHRLFAELDKPIPDGDAVRALVDEIDQRLNGTKELCEQCARHCAEVTLREPGTRHDYPYGKPIIRWDELFYLASRVQEALDDEVLERNGGESDLHMIRRFLSEAIAGGWLADWNRDVAEPELIGVKFADRERWAWLYAEWKLILDSPVFASKAEAELHITEIGFRSADEVTETRLLKFGFEHLDTQSLTKRRGSV